jgi:hypothetical protein
MLTRSSWRSMLSMKTMVTEGRVPPSHVRPNMMHVGVVLWLADVGVGWQRNAISSQPPGPSRLTICKRSGRSGEAVGM